MRVAWILALSLASLEASADESLRIQGATSIAENLRDAVSGRFAARYADLNLEWGDAGSGAAFGALFAGEAELAITARSAGPDEVELARRLGLELEEVALGLSGIAVVVHPDNDVPSLSLEELATLYSGRIVRWLGVGGIDEEVHLLSLPEASGVREVFEQVVVGDPPRKIAPTRTYLSAAALVDRVAKDRGALGFVSSSYNRSSVRTLPIARAKGEPPVSPSLETFSGAYPLSYAIWLYMLGEPRGELRHFITFLLLHDGPELLLEADLLPLQGFSAVSRRVHSRSSTPEVSVTRIGFGFRGSRLGRTARRDLDAIAERLARVDADVWIAGHFEPEEGNEELALARAESVAEFLSRAGVARSRMIVKERGAREPVASNETLEGRRANRRADVWVVPVR